MNCQFIWWDRGHKVKMQLDVEVSPPANGVQMSNLKIHKSVKVVTYKGMTALVNYTHS